MDQTAQEDQGNHNVQPRMRWYRIYRESIWKDRGNDSLYNYEPVRLQSVRELVGETSQTENY